MSIYTIFPLLGLMFVCYISQAGANDEFLIKEKIGHGVFTPENPPIVDYQDSDLTIQPIYSTDQISILISDKVSSTRPRQLRVSLPDVMAQLNEVKPFHGNKIIAIGLANSAVSVIAIIDRRRGVVSDTFYGYSPAISPDGHWIAFQEFFPSHGYNNIKSCYRVYDVSQSAHKNRHDQADDTDPQLVGFSIYPVRIGSQKVECGATDNDGEFMMASNTFTWTKMSDQFVFSVSEGKKLNLILVKLDKKNKQWTTFVYDLNQNGAACSLTCESTRVASVDFATDVINVQVNQGELGGKPINMAIPIIEFKATRLSRDKN